MLKRFAKCSRVTFQMRLPVLGTAVVSLSAAVVLMAVMTALLP
jgi:hypothetical protein